MQFRSFSEFYPFYLRQHLNPVCRLLHVSGVVAAISWMIYVLAIGKLSLLPGAIILGYGFAWPGHYIFEKNRPATFKHPLYSFMGDFRMAYEVLTFRRGLTEKT